MTRDTDSESNEVPHRQWSGFAVVDEDETQLELPQFTRPIAIAQQPGREGRPTNATPALLSTFTGLSTFEVTTDGRPMPSLSYLTLQAFVRRELVEPADRGSGWDQPTSAESPNDERGERNVHQLLESGDESETDKLSMDLVSVRRPSHDRRAEAGERALTGDDPTGVDSTSEGEHGDSGRTRDAGIGGAIGRRPRLATLDRPPTTIRRRAATETPGTVQPFSDSAVSPEFGTSAPDQDERSLWSGDDAGVAGDDMRTAPGESTDVGASPASRPLADDVVSSTNRETRLSDQRADPAMTYREPESTRRPGQTNASDTGRSVDTAAQTVDRSPGDADNGRERSEREETTQAPDPDVDVDRLVDRVYDEFQRKLRIERERRGL